MKSFIIICCFFLLLGACQSKPKGYVIKGMFEGAPENEWVFLTDLGQKVYYDSVQLKGGQFEFRGRLIIRNYVVLLFLKIRHKGCMAGVTLW